MSMLHPEEPMTDYHELPEVPRCCATCAHIAALLEDRNSTPNLDLSDSRNCAHPDVVTRLGYMPHVALHGYCGRWEVRRDE